MIGTIENSMIEAVASANKGYNLKKVSSYGGEFAEGIEKQARDFPVVLFVFGGATPVKQVGATVRWTAKWMALCCAKNLRNEVSARQGSTDSVGSYQLSMDVISILTNKKFGLDITPIEPKGWEPLLNDKAENQLVSVYGVTFETSFETQGSDAINPRPGVFETWHANWDVPAFGNVTPPPPNDEEADATDNVTLPTP